MATINYTPIDFTNKYKQLPMELQKLLLARLYNQKPLKKADIIKL